VATIVITEFMDPDSVKVLSGFHDVVVDTELATEPGRIGSHNPDALIVRNVTPVTAELISGLPKLRVVGRLGVGLDNIDTDACASRGVTVHTAAGANAIAVAEHVIGGLLVLARPALRSSQRILEGEWPRTELVGTELSGKRLGLVGLGATAREVASRALAIGMSVTAYDPFVTSPPTDITMASLDDLFPSVDMVSVHVPLTPETEALIDESRISNLSRGAFLVDTSRGGVVDHVAVIKSLRSGHLGGAALDVFEQEPPHDITMYRNVPNLVLTPHVGGVTAESNQRVSAVVASAVLSELSNS